MTNTVYCQKLKKNLPGLHQAPFQNELGQKILENISQEAWLLWLKHQTMLINEKRLNVVDPDTRVYLTGEMEKFLFGGDYDMPEGYVPPEN